MRDDLRPTCCAVTFLKHDPCDDAALAGVRRINRCRQQPAVDSEAEMPLCDYHMKMAAQQIEPHLNWDYCGDNPPVKVVADLDDGPEIIWVNADELEAAGIDPEA